MNIRLHFTLVGKTNNWSRIDDSVINWTNKNTLGYVKGMVYEQFGDRALVIANEHSLADDGISYPQFYSAGWFIDDAFTSELVVLAHGDTMEEANKSMIEHVKSISWGKYSVSI